MGGGGSREQASLDDPEIVEQGSFTEINIVPLVDIMLVLLVILMAASTTIVQAGARPETTGFEVSLPTGAQGAPVDELSDELVVTVLEDGTIVLRSTVVSLTELEAAFADAATKNDGRLVLVQADESSRHRRVVEVMETARRVGLNNLAIATRPQQ